MEIKQWRGEGLTKGQFEDLLCDEHIEIEVKKEPRIRVIDRLCTLLTLKSVAHGKEIMRGLADAADALFRETARRGQRAIQEVYAKLLHTIQWREKVEEFDSARCHPVFHKRRATPFYIIARSAPWIKFLNSVRATPASSARAPAPGV